MEQVDCSGDGTTNHLTQTSSNITVTLDTILKGKEIRTYEGPKALERDWKRSHSLQTSNGQILAHRPRNNDFLASTFTHTGQSRNPASSVVLPRENCLNERPREASATGEKLLLQKSPVQLTTTSYERQNAPSASTSTNISQQPISRILVLNTRHLSGSSKNNLCIIPHQQHVMIADNSANVGHFGAVLAQDQTVKLCQLNASMPNDVCQLKYIPQKAVAVVTPLTQQVEAGVTFSNKSYILCTLQSTTNENGTKPLCDNSSKAAEVPLKSVAGISQNVKHDGPAENNKLPGESGKLSSVRLKCASIERKEEVQPCPGDDNRGTKSPDEDDNPVMGRKSEDTEPIMDDGMDKLSDLPVREWSLQRLRTLVSDLEQKQQMEQKGTCFKDLSSEILKMYWKGDYQKLCDAAKSKVYIRIMKDVRLYCGYSENVIIQGVSQKRLKETASNFHILEPGTAPPKMVYTSSWLNVSEQHLHDLNIDHDSLSPLRTLHYKPKIVDKEVPVKEMENIQEPTNEKMTTNDEVLTEGEKRSDPLPAEHQKNSSGKGDKMETRDPVVVNVENICSVKETDGMDDMTVKDEIMQRAQSEEQNETKCESDAPLLVPLNTQSSDVSASCIKPEKLLTLSTTDTNPTLEKNGSADCTSVEMSILPLEKPAGEPDDGVNDMQKDEVQISTNSNGRVAVELFDEGNKHIPSEIKSDEMSSAVKINWQSESYCCLGKWFQVLGYRHGGLCMCEKKAELRNLAGTSGIIVKEVNANKHRYPFKFYKLLDHDIRGRRDNVKAKNRLEYRSMGVTSPIDDDDDDASMDELEIVDVITNYEDVIKMANEASEKLAETALITRTSQQHTTDRTHHTGINQRNPTPEPIHLTLYGTSHKRQKRNVSRFMPFGKVQLPPETVNVKINSGPNVYPNSTKSQTTKQEVWNSWRKTFVPNMSTKRKSKKRKCTQAVESKSEEAGNAVTKSTALDLSATLLSCDEDEQTHQPEAKFEDTDTDQPKRKYRKRGSARTDVKTKLKKMSFNLNKRWNCANKITKSPFGPARDINKNTNKLNTGLALNFRVLPESFNIPDDNSTMEASSFASAASGSKVKTMKLIRRSWIMSGTWSVSPRKKHCLKSTPTLPNTSGSSTFQEFKKKYERKKLKIPT